MDDSSGLFQQANYAFDVSEFQGVADAYPKESVCPDWTVVLEALSKQEQAIRGSGEIAPAHVYVDEYSTHGKRYARLRATGKRTLPGSSQKTRGLGKFGGAQHMNWMKRCDRRNQLQKIERRVRIIQQWMAEDNNSNLEKI